MASMMRTIRRNITRNAMKKAGYHRPTSRGHTGIVRHRKIFKDQPFGYFATSTFAKVWAREYNKVATKSRYSRQRERQAEKNISITDVSNNIKGGQNELQRKTNLKKRLQSFKSFRSS